MMMLSIGERALMAEGDFFVVLTCLMLIVLSVGLGSFLSVMSGKNDDE